MTTMDCAVRWQPKFSMVGLLTKLGVRLLMPDLWHKPVLTEHARLSNDPSRPQPRIPMVEGLEKKLNVSMPDLESPGAKDFLVDLVRSPQPVVTSS